MTDIAVTSGFEDKEIEVLIFNVGQYRLGINLGKVREITRLPPIKAIPYSHPVVEGLFELRGRLIPVLSLRSWLGVEGAYPRGAKIVIAEFLGLKTGFLVDDVERIHRVGWKDIEPPDRIKHYSTDILGTVKLEDHLVNMIDYEHIVLAVKPETLIPGSPAAKSSKRLAEKRKTKSIWILEDSKIIRDFLKDLLKENGYTNIIFFENGKHALDTLGTFKKDKRTRGTEPGETERVDVIITDIEMPVMNGYTFIKRLKEDEQLKTIPVIIFSSMLSSGHKLKGEVVEADAQLAKDESANLVHLIDRLIFR